MDKHGMDNDEEGLPNVHLQEEESTNVPRETSRKEIEHAGGNAGEEGCLRYYLAYGENAQPSTSDEAPEESPARRAWWRLSFDCSETRPT